MNFVTESINLGKLVITHESSVSVPGWSGAGYAVLDPDTNTGAWMISGGNNGGESSLLEDFASMLILWANSDNASTTFKRLANFAGFAFGFVGDFVELLNAEGCGLGDAAGGESKWSESLILG